MIVPNKVISFEDSIINQMLQILEVLKDKSQYPIVELFDEYGAKFIGIEEFIYSIDVLYILGTIDVDKDSGVITYVKTD